MKTELQERMAPVLQRLAEALVAAIPEAWTAATLRVEVRPQGDGGGIAHAIWSTQDPAETAAATDAVVAATRELQLLCAEGGQPWSALLFEVERGDPGWQHSADFDYPD